MAKASSTRRPAKRSPAPDGIVESAASKVSAWLTAAERKLLDGTLGRSLAEGSEKQLKGTLARARTLRDKWRDLFARQTKAAKRTPRRDATANTRSLDKAELFAAAVRRVEARLGELLAPAAPAPPERPAAPPRAPRSTPPAVSKKARQAGTRKIAAAATGAVAYDSRKQRSAKASALASRIKLDGLSTRRRGHTLALGKRKQARRDGR